jgi:hypothetical protein
VQELTLSEAEHSVNGSILNELSSVDLNYAELDTTGIITLIFDNISEPQQGYIRDYVFETTGKYTAAGQAPFNKGINGMVSNINPKSFKLNQNYPNPFNPITKITYELPVNSKVTLKIYDVLGREVANLITNKFETAGVHEIQWNASGFSSGIYIYRIEAGKFADSKKMVLIK